MENNPVVIVKNLSKSYTIRTDDGKTKSKTKLVLDNINLSINKGEIFGILGENGSGKSTLLKIIQGIFGPTNGTVKIHGKVSSILELTIGFHDDLSGLENIYIRAKLYGIPRNVIEERLDSILEYTELGDVIHDPVRTYSSGMKQRLAFAIMINVDADIFVVDEALSVGDLRFKAKTSGFLHTLSLRGKTVIITSHSSQFLKMFCTRAAVLKNGKIVFDGLPEQACAMYETIDLCSQDSVEEYAKKGAPQAEYRLQKQYAAEGNKERYLEWIEKAAYSNHQNAVIEYAQMCAENGDKDLALKLLLSVAKRGNPIAMWRYSAMMQGFGDENVSAIIKKIAEKGDHFDHLSYAEYLRLTSLNEKDLADAYAEYLKSAESGNLDAKFESTMMLLDGIGTDADPVNAIESLRKLGEEGNIDAMTELTKIYANGLYTSPNPNEQFYWHLKLANAGVSKNQFVVACMYLNGLGTEKNESEAKAWFKKYTISSLEIPLTDIAESAKNRNPYLDSDSSKINMFLATGYSRRALMQYLDSMLNTKKIKNKDFVFDVAKQAATSASQSRVYLADCYYKGIGTETDLEAAFRYYKSAADNGNARAMVTVALMYRDGVGVEPNKKLFHTYLQMSAKKHNPIALTIINEMEKKNKERLKMMAIQRAKNKKTDKTGTEK